MTWFLAAVLVLLAILVAVAIPSLLQLRATLASVQNFLDTTAPRLDKALEQVTTSAERIEEVAGQIEGRVNQVKAILDTTTGVVTQVRNIQDTVRTAGAIGRAVGPAIAAAIRAFVGRSQHPDSDESSNGPHDASTTGEDRTAEFEEEIRS